MSKGKNSNKKKKSSAATEAKAERSETPEQAPSMSRAPSQASVTTTNLSRATSKASINSAASVCEHKNRPYDEEARQYYLETYEEKYGPSVVTLDGTDYLISDEYKIHAASVYDLKATNMEMGYEKHSEFTMHDIVMLVNKGIPIKDECRILPPDMDTSEPFLKHNSSKRKVDEADNDSISNVSTEGTTNAVNVQETVEVSDKELPVYRLKPIPIMVMGIATDKLKQFAKLLAGKGNPAFELMKAGRFIRVFPITDADKTKIVEILEDVQIQFYIVPDRTALFKAVLKGVDSLDPI